MTMQQHFRLLGWFLLVFGIIGVLLALTFGLVLSPVHHLLGSLDESSGSQPDEDEFMRLLFTGMAIWLTGNLIISLLYSVSGGGLLKRKRWARPCTIATSIVSLPGLPFGTALGIYGLWLMYSAEGAQAWADYSGQSDGRELRDQGI